MSAPGKHRIIWPSIYALVLASFLIIFSTPGIRVSDEFSYLLMIDAYAQQGSLVLDNGLDVLHSNQQRIPGTTFAHIDGVRLAGIPAPLYPVIAAPLYRLWGLWGPMTLNVCAYTATAVLVALMARTISPASKTLPLAAAALWSAATYSLAYAPMLWPHALSVLLVTGASYLILSATKRPQHHSALLAGLFAGAALGLRYPNAVYAVVLGAFLIFRRRSILPAYLAGVALPLAVVVYINTLVFHHPLVTGYGNLLVMGAKMLVPAVFLLAGAAIFWFLRRRLATDNHHRTLLPLLLSTGLLTILLTGIGSSVFASLLQKVFYADVPGAHPYPLDKKALLQSTPYLILALPAAIHGWKKHEAVLLWTVLAAAGVLVWGPASLGGVNETLGMRYLLEIVPFLVLLSLSAVTALKQRPDTRKGGVLAVILILSVIGFSSQPFLLYPRDADTLSSVMPPGIALGVIGLYVLARKRPAYTTAFWAFFTIAVAWSGSVAYADSVVGARRTTEVTTMSQTLDQALPQRAAVLVYGSGEAGLLYRSAISKDVDIYTVANDPADTQRVVQAYQKRDIPVYAVYWAKPSPLQPILEELPPTLKEDVLVLQLMQESVYAGSTGPRTVP